MSPATQPGCDPADALYSVDQIRAVEQAAQAALPAHTLMQRAGEAAAAVAMSMLARENAAAGPLRAPAVLLAAGTGNNGGDAYECAARLARHGCAVTVLMPSTGTQPNAGTDAGQALAKARRAAVTFVDIDTLALLSQQPWALVIDGLFGIGLTRPLSGAWAIVIEALNSIDAPLLALDVPSGLDADTGMIMSAAGMPGACIRATRSITFIGNKPGLHTADGRDHAGLVTVAPLDSPPGLFPAPCARLNGIAEFRMACRPRRHASHKGSFGDVQVVGGAPGMVGAAILAGHAALKMGSGRVLIGFVDPARMPQFIPRHPELLCRAAASLDFSTGSLVVGPGLGATAAAGELVASACASHASLVLDADALNLLAATPVLEALVVERARRGVATVLTPHPLEAARLLGVTAAAVQADRLAAAAALATRFAATVVLKGSGTVIGGPNGLLINPTGNPALASGGTGDVLAGICGALLAQEIAPEIAAAAAVWLHGAAADRLVAHGIGPIGVTASEIIDAARSVYNELCRDVRPGGPP